MNNFLKETFVFFSHVMRFIACLDSNPCAEVNFYLEVGKTTQASQILASQLWVGDINFSVM